jgi:predicted nucleotidyltransferase component of viral defense system
MSERPQRDTVSGRVYLDLQNRARREGRPTDELFVLYVLERFLFRLSISPHRERLVLKGGMLLAVFEERRATRDVDLLARGVSNDIDEVAAVIREVVAIDVDDGVVFEADRLDARVIRDDELYAGVRIVVPARIDRAQHPLHLDVNVGDPVTPAPVDVEYPALLTEPFTVVGYPIETVLAEKIVTMIERGDATTRERDFADVVLLTRRHAVDAVTLRAAINATAAHRQAEVRPLRGVLVTLASARQPDWERFVSRTGVDAPGTYAEAIERIAEFADPILAGDVSAGRWDPVEQAWRR